MMSMDKKDDLATEIAAQLSAEEFSDIESPLVLDIVTATFNELKNRNVFVGRRSFPQIT